MPERQIFAPEAGSLSAEHARVYARYELYYTCADLVASVSFIIGSFLFFFETWAITATWFFLIGSFCFAAKPCLRFVREWRYWRLGEIQKLASKYES